MTRDKSKLNKSNPATKAKSEDNSEPNQSDNSITEEIIAWIAEHPYQTIFHVLNGVVLFTPAAATVPILNALGFSASGPVAGILHTCFVFFVTFIKFLLATTDGM